MIELSRRRSGISLSIVFALITRRDRASSFPKHVHHGDDYNLDWHAFSNFRRLLKLHFVHAKNTKSFSVKESKYSFDIPEDSNHHRHHQSISADQYSTKVKNDFRIDQNKTFTRLHRLACHRCVCSIEVPAMMDWWSFQKLSNRCLMPCRRYLGKQRRKFSSCSSKSLFKTVLFSRPPVAPPKKSDIHGLPSSAK